MVLGKFMRWVLIIFDLTLIYFIFSRLILKIFPVDRPAFWIASIIEIGLGILTYRLWMRSILGKEYRVARVQAFLLILIGVIAPILLYYSQIDYLLPTVNADLFYIATIITLIIYSSFRVRNHLKMHQTPI